MMRYGVAICCLLGCLAGLVFADSVEGPLQEGREIGGSGKPAITISIRPVGGTAYPVTKADLVANQRHHLIRALKDLQDDYTTAGMLDEAIQIRRQIRALEKHAAVSLPAAPATPPPGAQPPTGSTPNAVPAGFGTEVGRTYFIPVVGRTTGTVWGDGPYTTDSDLATAAVHAGVLKDGRAAVLKVTVLPGESSYRSSTSHGVTTNPWQSYPASFRIDGAGESITTASHLRGSSVEVVTVHVLGQTTGPVWGTDDYTDDSDIATAAVHAGLVKAGEEALVLLTPRSGLDSYTGSDRNGVHSAGYRNWGGGYRLERLPGDQASSSGPSEILRGVTSLEEWRSKTGTRLRIEVTGQVDGAVYGTDVYTTDSSVATAAVHAGVVEVGQTAILTVEVVGEHSGFTPSTRNGITSLQWQTWGGYRFVTGASAHPVEPVRREAAVLQRETKSVTGKTIGPVWGTDIYTDDSDIGTAAVHAGRLKEGETAILTIEYIEAPSRHQGSNRNGVETRSWSSTWQRSFRFVDPAPQFGRGSPNASGVHFF